MTNHAITAAACAALGVLIAGPASAACALSAQPIVVSMKTQRPLIDVKVDGKVGHFLLDSATAVNLMNNKFANAQKLTPTKISATGPSVVKAAQFEFAGATLKDAPFVATEVADADGVIGQTFLHQGDVEYDLATGSVKLAKAVGCEGSNMAYWAKDGDVFFEAALTPTAKEAPFTTTEVIVNGVKLRGMFSTGKRYSSITEKAAAKAGVKPGDAGVKSMGTNAWAAPFASVIVGNEETKGGNLEIDRTNDDLYDVLIGTDFFLTHHLYVANSQQKIYFTKAGFPGGKVFDAHPKEASALQTQGHLQDHYSPGNDN